MTVDVMKLYETMLAHMGPQGWWPADSKVEIILGAILVQNTAWRNAAKALDGLRQKTDFSPDAIGRLNREELEALVRPSGFYQNKTRAIQGVWDFFAPASWDYAALARQHGSNLRQDLLALPGIGQETADVLLVYVFDQPVMIADHYARQLFSYLTGTTYQRYVQLKKAVVLPEGFTAAQAQEFHGLIDEFGKQWLKDVSTFQKSFLADFNNALD